MSRVGVRPSAALAGAWAVALLLTACGGDGQEAAAPTTTTVTATAPAPPPVDDGAPSPAPGTETGAAPGTGDRPRADDQRPGDDEVPPPGTTFTGEPISAEHAADLQEEVDAGHEPWRLDQSSVAAVFAGNRFGWTDVEIALDDPHTVQVTDPVSRHLVSLQLRQPVREGETGIWVVDSGVWLG